MRGLKLLFCFVFVVGASGEAKLEGSLISQLLKNDTEDASESTTISWAPHLRMYRDIGLGFGYGLRLFVNGYNLDPPNNQIYCPFFWYIYKNIFVGAVIRTIIYLLTISFI